jgi:hypothetical protein
MPTLTRPKLPSSSKRRDHASSTTPSAQTLRLTWKRITGRDGRTQLVCRWAPVAT